MNLWEADKEIYESLISLVKGESLVTYIDIGVIYSHIKNDVSTIHGFLLAAGYLKVLKTMVGGNGNLLCEMDLPNREISIVYQKEIIIEETDEIVERDGI